MLLSIAFTVISAMWSNQAIGLFSNVIIGVYIWFTWSGCKNSIAVSSRIGENAYFIGYLTTITGLCGVALEIHRDPSLLEVRHLPSVLLKGATALVTTIVGLVGMNFLKQHAHALEQHLEDNASKTTDIVQELLQRFAEKMLESERTRDDHFIKLFESSQLSENMHGLARNLDAGAKSLDELQKTSLATNDTLASLKTHMASVSTSVSLLNSATQSIAPAWESIGKSLEKVDQFSGSVSNVTASMRQFNETVSAGNAKTNEYLLATEKLHVGLSESLSMLDQRVQALSPLADSVEKFVRLANQIAPLLHSIGDNFENLNHVKETIVQFRHSMHELNSMLVSTSSGIQQLRQDSRDMANASADLVAHMKNDVAALKRLSDPLSSAVNRLGEVLENALKQLSGPMEAFGTTCVAMSPNFQAIRNNLVDLETFTTEIQRLHESLIKFNTTIGDSTSLTEELRSVIENFARLQATPRRGSF